MPQQSTPEERFWSKLTPQGECLIWLGSPKARYPKTTYKGNPVSVHVLAFVLRYGPVPPGKYVCHNCPGGDNPRCCNPDHLWAGTNQENILDASRKGRLATRDRHPFRINPELVARGDRTGSRKYPERRPRGDHHGTHTKPESVPKGMKHPNAKMTDEQVLEIRRLYVRGVTRQVDLARQFGTTQTVVSGIVRGATWTHLL